MDTMPRMCVDGTPCIAQLETTHAANRVQALDRLAKDMIELKCGRSFESFNGRKPIAGVDFDPDAPMCQDDFEYFTGTGRYAPDPAPTDVELDADLESRYDERTEVEIC